MRALRLIGWIVLVLVIGFGLLWIVRSDPIGPLSGRAFTGEEAPYPDDWSFSDEHMTIAIEVRPEDPHSVTTICFVVDGVLHVPASNGSKKRWTQYLLEDPRVRLKIGDRVYPANAVRVTPEDPSYYLKAGGEKYPRLLESSEDPPDDLWLFRIDPV